MFYTFHKNSIKQYWNTLRYQCFSFSLLPPPDTIIFLPFFTRVFHKNVEKAWNSVFLALSRRGHHRPVPLLPPSIHRLHHLLQIVGERDCSSSVPSLFRLLKSLPKMQELFCLKLRVRICYLHTQFFDALSKKRRNCMSFVRFPPFFLRLLDYIKIYFTFFIGIFLSISYLSKLETTSPELWRPKNSGGSDFEASSILFSVFDTLLSHDFDNHSFPENSLTLSLFSFSAFAGRLFSEIYQ